MRLIPIMLALACAPSPAERPARDARRSACWDDAEAAAQRRIDAECPGPFDTCTTANEIVADLRREQEKCP